MSTEPISVYASSRDYEAQAVLDMLLQEGIEAYPVARANPNSVGFGGLTLGSGIDLPTHEIFAPAEQAEKALELIGGFLGSLGMLGELTLEELEEAAIAEQEEREFE